MFAKTKKVTILLAASLFLATSLGENIALADTVVTDNNNPTTATTVKTDSNTAVTTAANNNDANKTTVTTTPNNNNIDTAAVKTAMFSELNRLRSQNNLQPLTSVAVLNNYAQTRTDSFIDSGGVDNHAGWKSDNMYPYNHTAEENISQMPFSMLGTTDSSIIAQKITHEFYSELYDPEPNYGHRKNMLNPYINYVGIGVTLGNGILYASQEMGNDQATYDKYNPNDIYAYYLTKYNDYSNPSQYDIADNSHKNADYTRRDKYSTADVRGGVTTKNHVTQLYDRYGKQQSGLTLSPNSDWLSDLIGIIDGNYYYHVSDNGFVSANDVLPWASFLSGSSITTTTIAKIYDNNGIYTGKTVAANSKWIVDRRAENPLTFSKMYRIGTNAWLQDNQITRN